MTYRPHRIMQSCLHLPGIPDMRSVSCGMTTHEQKKAARHLLRSGGTNA